MQRSQQRGGAGRGRAGRVESSRVESRQARDLCLRIELELVVVDDLGNLREGEKEGDGWSCSEDKQAAPHAPSLDRRRSRAV